MTSGTSASFGSPNYYYAVTGDTDTHDRPSQDETANWTSFLDGAKRFIDTLIDLGEESGDEDRDPRQGRVALSADTSGVVDHEVKKDLSERFEDDAAASALALPTTPGRPLVASSVDEPGPEVWHQSNLIDFDLIRALAAEIPSRHRQAKWQLIYSSQRDGISLQTMLRKSKGRSPTVLLVRDLGKAVFGAYCSEAWRTSSRYFGTGETFVFTVKPKPMVWHWWWKKMNVQQNDFFMWATSEGIAVGGAGAYAIWLDSDLLTGISRTSATFGNDCLASEEEFRIGAVECWWLS